MNTFSLNSINTSHYFYITLVVIIFILLLLFTWIFNRLGLKTRSCNKLKLSWPTLTNTTYLISYNRVKTDRENTFDGSSCKFVNYHIKSAYNCCCGDGYKNNFVDLCALEKCISNGCRFLDFEIYSLNNLPIVASSTANNNYIKETYNSLPLEVVLQTIKEKGFNATLTNCANDPLILHFRIMSTNVNMLKTMGELFDTNLNGTNQDFTLELKKGPALLDTEMKNLYKKLIIICEFNPQSNIIDGSELQQLSNFINLNAKGTDCNTFRYNQITSKKGSLSFITETKRKFIIVLPNLDNSIINYDPKISFDTGCQAICMKHQNVDNNLLGYNARFKLKNNYSWIKKDIALLNESAPNIPTYTPTVLLPGT